MKKLILVLLSAFLCISLFGCKEDNNEFDIHTDVQNSALNRSDKALILLDATGVEELSIPKPVTLKWKSSVTDGTLIIKNISGDYEVSYTVSGTSADIYNLRIADEYTWSINGEDQGSFKITTNTARFLKVDGVTNIRDLGGWKTATGVVKQDMLIRSAKFTADETGDVLITEAGIKALTKIGIKTELDLRKTIDGEAVITSVSALGSKVKYIQFPMQSSGNVLTLNKSLLPELFKILGNEDNYPMVFHCSIGTDRTGLVACLVLSILGVSKDDIRTDYMLSNLGLIGGSRTVSVVNKYFELIEIAEGDTYQEQAVNYLLSKGVSQTDIDNVIRILSE